MLTQPFSRHRHILLGHEIVTTDHSEYFVEIRSRHSSHKYFKILKSEKKERCKSHWSSCSDSKAAASVRLRNDRPDSNPLPADDGTQLHLSVGKIVRVVEEDDRCKKKSTEVVTKQLGKFKV